MSGRPLVAEDQNITVGQRDGDRFALDHGSVVLHGADDTAPLAHEVAASITHGTAEGRPLVHMLCWDTEPCDVSVSGTVALVGNEDAPVVVKMQHEFTGDHHQTLAVDPVDHTLHLDTAAAAPIHHALQLRTPLDVRFCNPWHIASDYVVEVNLGNNRVIGIRLTGATVATPQPCEDPCPPPAGRKQP